MTQTMLHIGAPWQGPRLYGARHPGRANGAPTLPQPHLNRALP